MFPFQERKNTPGTKARAQSTTGYTVMPVEKTGTVVTYADRSPLSMFFLHPWSAVVDTKTEVTNIKHTPKQTVQANSLVNKS